MTSASGKSVIKVTAMGEIKVVARCEKLSCKYNMLAQNHHFMD